MSTLTSAEMHVKRSSTRLHAPPGGVSSLSFGSGGFGTAEPAEEVPSKEDPAYTRPSSGGYAPSTVNFNNNNNNNAPGGCYPSYSSSQQPDPYNKYTPSQQMYQQPDPAPYNNCTPSQQMYQQQQSYQYQPPYNPNGYNYGNNSFSGPGYATNNSGYQAGRPPSSTPSTRSSARTSSSSSSWGSQPPLTSSKRDQTWEKKRRSWLARKNSSNGSNYGECPPTSSSTWSSGPVGGSLNDTMNSPASPLSKFMHQHAQQQQPPPPTPHGDYQRLDTASSSRSNNYMHQSYPTQQQMPNPGYPARASLSRAGLSTASSTVSTSRRQPPGGRCQWSLG